MRNRRFIQLTALFVAAMLLAGSVMAEIPTVPFSAAVPFSVAVPVLRGFRFDPSFPLKLDFILENASNADTLSKERLVRYFLSALTLPEKNLWVNLSPYEPDRIIDDKVVRTEVGRVLLEQDYLLKQVAASLTHPDTPAGRVYWGIENRELKMENGLTQISTEREALSKIWIKPGEVRLYDENNIMLINDLELEVFSETDQQSIILSEVKDLVNNSEQFASLRQMMYSVILAQWFKRKFADSFYSFYFNSEKTAGIEFNDPAVKDEIFQRYVSAYKDGAYDFARKEYVNGELIKRRYFSGGISSSIDSKQVTFQIYPADIDASWLQAEFKVVSSSNAGKYESYPPPGNWVYNALYFLNEAVTVAYLFSGKIPGILEQSADKSEKNPLNPDDRDTLHDLMLEVLKSMASPEKMQHAADRMKRFLYKNAIRAQKTKTEQELLDSLVYLIEWYENIGSVVNLSENTLENIYNKLECDIDFLKIMTESESACFSQSQNIFIQHVINVLTKNLSDMKKSQTASSEDWSICIKQIFDIYNELFEILVFSSSSLVSKAGICFVLWSTLSFLAEVDFISRKEFYAGFLLSAASVFLVGYVMNSVRNNKINIPEDKPLTRHPRLEAELSRSNKSGSSITHGGIKVDSVFDDMHIDRYDTGISIHQYAPSETAGIALVALDQTESMPIKELFEFFQ